MSWTCPTWWLAGSSSFLLPHWWTLLWPPWQEELPNPHWTVFLAHSSVWTDSIVVAASVAIQVTPPSYTACSMLCPLSLFQGERTWSCVLSKNAAHFVRVAKCVASTWQQGEPGVVVGGSWNKLLSTRNLSIPGFHPIRSHGGRYWEPLNEFYRSPFSNEK